MSSWPRPTEVYGMGVLEAEGIMNRQERTGQWLAVG